MCRVCVCLHNYNFFQVFNDFLFLVVSTSETHCGLNFFFVGVRSVRFHNVGSIVGPASTLARLRGLLGGEGVVVVVDLNGTGGAIGTAGAAGIGGVGGFDVFISGGDAINLKRVRAET
jgi:hypothetical protein